MGWTVEGAGRGFVFRQAGRGKAILEGTERKKRFSSGGGGYGEVGKVRGRGGVSRQAEEGLVRLGRCWTELPFLAGFLEKIF